MQKIQISKLSYQYDKRKTDGIKDLDLSIPMGKITAIIGPSGSGKTTTLKCISGLLDSYKGEINFPSNEKPVYLEQNIDINDGQLTVYELLEKEILNSIKDEEKRSNQIRSALSDLDITNEIHSKFHQLSGGQKQRVFIARALIHNPTVLLLDEPFANLDRVLRQQLLNELFDLLKSKRITLIWVTHSVEEALGHADFIAVLNFGSLQQFGVPSDLYYRPQNLFIAHFISEGNIIAEKVEVLTKDKIEIKLFGKSTTVFFEHQTNIKEGDFGLFFIPSEAIEIHQLPLPNEEHYHGKITRSQFQGPTTVHTINIKSKIVKATSPSKGEVLSSNKLSFTINPMSIYCIGKA